MKPISDYLKDKRVASGLTQRELARKLGYTNPQFISNWERGICYPPLKQIKVLCLLLDIPVKTVKMKMLNEFKEKLDREFRGM